MELEFLDPAKWPVCPGTTAEITKNINIWCGKLSVTVSNLLGRINTLEAEKKDQNEEMMNIKNELEELKKLSIINKNQSSTGPSSWANIAGGKKTNDQVDLLLATSKETKQQYEKENNVIIFGIKESEKLDIESKKQDDKTELIRLFDAMKLDKIKVKRSYRIKSNNNKNPAPIIVVFEDVISRNFALKCGKNLVKTEYSKNVFINPDRTESQRLNFKRLLDERKQKNSTNEDISCYFGIRNDKVIKITKRTD